MFEIDDLIIDIKNYTIIRATEFDIRHSEFFRKATDKEIMLFFKKDLDEVLIKYKARLYSEDDNGVQHTVCAFSKGVFSTDLQEPNYHW